MFKNQLQELAQRSCFNLPSYSAVKEGPDHAPRFKSTVTFNGESFESPDFFNNLRLAEHAAAEVALTTLSKRGASQSSAPRILDETGVCKSMLQEAAQRAGVKMPVYSVNRSGQSHMPSFVCTVQVARRSFVGESAKTKKQAEKNAASMAWTSLKNSVIQGSALPSSSDTSNFCRTEEQMQAAIVWILKHAEQESCMIESSNDLSVQGSPPLRSPVCTPRIKITPFKDQHCQESVKVTDSLSSTSSVMTTDNKDRQPLISQTKVTTCKEQHAQEILNKPKHFVIMPTTKLENGAHSEQGNESSSQFLYPKGVANAPISKNGMIVCELPNSLQKVAHVQTVMVNNGSHPQMTFIPVNHLQTHDKHLVFSNASSVIIVKDTDTGSLECVLPQVQYGYTPVLWNTDCQQGISTGATFEPVASLAPFVHVRDLIPLCSPPYPFLKNEWDTNSTTAALEGLSNLKL